MAKYAKVSVESIDRLKHDFDKVSYSLVDIIRNNMDVDEKTQKRILNTLGLFKQNILDLIIEMEELDGPNN